MARLVLRFGAVYAVLLVVSVNAPVFEQLERPIVAGVNALLVRAASEGVTRRLDLIPAEPEWVYRLDVERDGEQREVEHRLHPHAYVLLLFVALVLATPALGWRARLFALAAGAGLGLPFAGGLLLSDVLRWEAAALPGFDPVGGTLSWAARAFGALHRSTGAALLPPLLWLLYAASRDGEAPARPARGADTRD